MSLSRSYLAQIRAKGLEAADTYERATLEECERILDSCGFAFVNFVFTVVGIALVERVGRRRLVLGSLSAVSLCLATLGFAFRLGSMSLAITATLLYIAAFAPGMCWH